MATESWADLGTPAPKAESWADLGAPAVKPESWADLGGKTPAKAAPSAPSPSVGPVFQNRSGLTVGNLLAHPINSLQRLAERFGTAGSDVNANTTLGGLAGKTAESAAGMSEQEIFDRSHRGDLAKSPLELAADVSGGFVGSLLTPESLLGLPAKGLAAIRAPVMQVLAKMGAGRTVQRVGSMAAAKGVEQAGINAATDPAIQGGNIALGQQDHYDPMQTVMNAGAGALFGTGLGGVGEAIKIHGSKSAASKEAYHGYNEGVIADTAGRPVEQGNPLTDLVAEEAPSKPAKGSIAEPVLPKAAESPTPEASDELLPASTTQGNLRGDPKPVVRSVADPGQEEPLARNVAQLADDLRQTLGVTHRQGKVGSKDALGTYNTKSGVVRTLNMHELPVLAHEAGHHLEYTVPHPELLKAMAAHEGELRPLDYDPQQQRRHEGFAEFLRWYLTNPEYARQAAPNFYGAFETAMAKDNPKALKGLQGVQSGFQAYLSAPSAIRVQSHIVQNQPESFGKEVAERFQREGPAALASSAYTATVDRLHPLKEAEDRLLSIIERRTGQRPDLKVAKSPYALSRLAPNAYGSGHMDIMHGVEPYYGGSGHNGGPPMGAETVGLSDALDTALRPRAVGGRWDHGAVKDFDAYLTARRMIGEWERYDAGALKQPPDILRKADYEAAVADYERVNPTFKPAADQVYEWQNAIWRKTRDAGFITEDTYQQGLAHKDYVPVMRDVSDRASARDGLEKASTGEMAGKTHRFEGSFRNVISPTQSMMRNAYRLSAMIARNDALKALDDLAQAAGPGGGAIAERLPRTEITLTKVDALEALASAAEKRGLNDRDIATLLDDVVQALGGAKEAEADIFRRSPTKGRGEPVVYVWRDGVAQPLRLPDGQFGKEMFEAVTNMTPMQKSLWTEIAAVPARIMRAGIVTHPSFLIRNPIVDQLTTYLTTNVGFVPGVDFVRGLGHEIKQSGLTQRYNRAGGIIGGAQTASEVDTRIKQQITALEKKGYRIRRLASWRGFSELAEMSETATRLGVFDRAYRKAIKAGMSELEASKEAAFAATDYMDFNRKGANAAVGSAQQAIPFLRVWGLGMDKMAQTITKAAKGSNLKMVLRPLLNGPPHTAAERDALETAMKVWGAMSALSVMSAGITALYKDDPEYENINDDLRATHWVVRAGDHWVFIPKPYEWGLLPDMAERMVEGTLSHDPLAWKRFGADIAQVFLPPTDMPVLSTPFELFANRNSMGQPIIPDHLKNVEPDLQVAANTSQVGRILGGMLHVSPAVVDHIITSVGSSWGRTGLQVGDRVLGAAAPIAGDLEDTPVASRFVKEPARGSRAAETFWGKVSAGAGSYTERANSFRIHAKDDPAKAVEYLNQLTPGERAYVAMDYAMPQIKDIHPLIRAQKMVGVLGDLRAAIKQGDVRGADLQVIHLTPEQRQTASNAIEKRIMAEQTNALISAGETGWNQRQKMPTDVVLPAGLDGALKLRMLQEKLDTDPAAQRQTEAAWASLRDTFEAKLPNFQVLIDAKQNKGSGPLTRAIEQVVPAR